MAPPKENSVLNELLPGLADRLKLGGSNELLRPASGSERFAPLQLPPILSFSNGDPSNGLFRPGPSSDGVGAPDEAARASQGDGAPPAPPPNAAGGSVPSDGGEGGVAAGDLNGNVATGGDFDGEGENIV
jgi:hypothetical protein